MLCTMFTFGGRDYRGNCNARRHFELKRESRELNKIEKKKTVEEKQSSFIIKE